MRKTSAQHVLNIIEYFSVFEYPVTLGEIYTFYPVKTTEKRLDLALEEMVKDKILIKDHYYTLPPYRIFIQKRKKRAIQTQNKLKKGLLYIRILRYIPIIKLIGLSGSAAMNNARKDDDIDLFVIASRNRLFLTRFITLLVAQIIGKRRRRKGSVVRDRLCLNLFFDETHLKVPKRKQNNYVAHEIVQMMPILMREGVYEKFIQANKWVFDYFPNASRVGSISHFIAPVGALRSSRYPQSHKMDIFAFVEWFLKKIQLFFINRHKTTELITDHQLWFFPDDYEKKLDKKFI